MSRLLDCCGCPCRCLQPVGRDSPCNVIAFAQKTLKDGQVVSKLHVIELGGAIGQYYIRQRVVCWF
jgi:clathrin heavy chain